MRGVAMQRKEKGNMVRESGVLSIPNELLKKAEIEERLGL